MQPFRNKPIFSSIESKYLSASYAFEVHEGQSDYHLCHQNHLLYDTNCSLNKNECKYSIISSPKSGCACSENLLKEISPPGNPGGSPLFGPRYTKNCCLKAAIREKKIPWPVSGSMLGAKRLGHTCINGILSMDVFF